MDALIRRQRDGMKLTRARLFLALAAVAMVVGVADLWFAWDTGVDQELSRSWALADEARSRIHIGMPLSEAEALLGDAWHHAACDYGEYDPTLGNWHLFLFGSRNLDKTGVVILRSMGPFDDQVVSFVGSTENYRLVPSWGICLGISGLRVAGYDA